MPADPVLRGDARALRRGDVVLRGRRYGVVWAVHGLVASTMPVLQPGCRRAHDVELAFPELLSAGVEWPHAVVRCAMRAAVPVAELRRVGELPGPLACRVSAAVARAFADAQVRMRWADEDGHPLQVHSERCVNLVG